MRSLSQLLPLVLPFVYKLTCVHSQLQNQDPPTCDWPADNCPYLIDKTCDAGSFCLNGTDCFDCDPCHQFDLNCSGCVANGCVYCPTDGICLSTALDESYWQAVALNIENPLQISCQTEEDWQSTCTNGDAASNNLPFDDPLYVAQQWVFDLMYVTQAWQQGYSGTGVVVRVNDPDGVDASHAELSPNFDASSSCNDFQPTNITTDQHGTSIASIAVGAGNNGQCAVGVATQATLTACKGPTRNDDASAVQFFRQGLATTHISINSWGFDACNDKDRRSSGSSGGGTTGETPVLDLDQTLNENSGGVRRKLQDDCPFTLQTDDNPCNECPDVYGEDCEAAIVAYCKRNYETDRAGCAEFLDLFVSCGYNALSQEGQDVLTEGVQQGRNGRGIIYVFAAGNEYARYENVNMEGWLNSRFTIVVGAVGKEGNHASYSSDGAAVFVSGPGGDYEFYSNHMTAKAGGGCMDDGAGTSFATPAVAGVIALMLEANPDLGWRDVQGILASTAQMMDDKDPTWFRNAAGLHHSYRLGFGVVNAMTAVSMAKSWVNFGPEKQILVESGPINLDIADDADNPTRAFLTVNEDSAIYAESVAVYLQLDHGSRGDLEIVLTSPQGTSSLLHPSKSPENQHLEGQNERWKLLTVRNYGEAINGKWTLTLRDERPGILSECVNFPFKNTIESNGELYEVTCASIETIEGICENGQVLNAEAETTVDDETGTPASESCCLCGGGFPASTKNQLTSWRLMVYGHESEWSSAGDNDVPAENNEEVEEASGAAAAIGQGYNHNSWGLLVTLTWGLYVGY